MFCKIAINLSLDHDESHEDQGTTSIFLVGDIFFEPKNLKNIIKKYLSQFLDKNIIKQKKRGTVCPRL